MPRRLVSVALPISDPLMTLTMLDIAGFGGEPVPNALIAHESSRHLAVVLPGLSYNALMPALFFPWRLLLEMGADVLRVDYDYARPERRGDPTGEMAARLTADVSAAVAAGLAAGDYRRVTLLGKSLGTMAMAHLLSTEPRLATADCIWLTPLLRHERLRSRLRDAARRSLLVIGTADAEHDPAVLAELRAAGADLLELEGAGHGLDVAEDVMMSIEYLATIARRIGAFIEARSNHGADEP